MKYINQSYEILGSPTSVEEAWAFAAKAARNCYQSEKTNPNESEEDFCKRLLLKNSDMECNHLSPLEFGIVYLQVPIEHPYISRIGVRINTVANVQYVSTNLRYLLEHDLMEDLKYAGPPTEHHIKACAFRLITNRAVMAEITRHRTLSFCIESTRYCNYSKNKFGNELTFIKPCWDEALQPHFEWVEKEYMNLLAQKWSPQQAAAILPNDLKTTIMMCGFEDSLMHMFKLRALECSGPVHPQMAELMKPLYKEWSENKRDFSL